MITSGFAQMIARYNKWQNESLYREAAKLSDAERRKDRGAFFRSIHETLSHILWADELWLSRFGVGRAPDGGIAESTNRFSAWTDLAVSREMMDTTMLSWAESLADDDFDGNLTWFSGALNRNITRPRALLIAHIFNHGTHHRGQVHAMLTAAGMAPEDTDIPFMPGLSV